MKQTAKIKFTANHPLHLACTIFTCGLWVPVWIFCTIVGRKTVITTDPFRPETYVPQQRRYVQPTQSCPGCGERFGHHMSGCQYWTPRG